MTMEFLKTFHFDFINLMLNLSDKRLKEQSSASCTKECKDPKILLCDGENSSNNTIPFVENKSDNTCIGDTFKVTLRRHNTAPVHNRSSHKRCILFHGITKR